MTQDENDQVKIAEIVGEVLDKVPVYTDAIQPFAIQVGKGLETVGKAVNLALEPLRGLIWGYDQIKGFFFNKVAQKLAHIPPEQIITPPPNVAGPAIEAIRFTGYNEELREMFANLLANSMDSNTTQNAHPSFVDIIKEMTSDEAKIMKYISSGALCPIINIKAENTIKQGGIYTHFNVSLLGYKSGCRYPQNTPTYLDNLNRLRLININMTRHYIDSKNYEELMKSKEVEMAKKEIENMEDSKFAVDKGIVFLTNYGTTFISVCILNKE